MKCRWCDRKIAHEISTELCPNCWLHLTRTNAGCEKCAALMAELARLRWLCGKAADRIEDMDTAWTIAWYNMTNEQKRKTLRDCDAAGLPNGFALMAISIGNHCRSSAGRGEGNNG